MLRQLRPLATPFAAGMILLLLGTHSIGDPQTEGEKPGLIPLKDDGWCHAFSPDGRTMATTVHRDPGGWLVRLRDRIRGAVLAEAEAGSEYPRYMTFSPDGRRLALVAWSRRLDEPPFLIRYWDITAAKKLTNAHVLRLDYSLCGRRAVFHCAFSPDGKTLAATTGREVIYVWETATGQLRRRFQGGLAAGFSADGRTLIAVTHDGLIRRFTFPACEFIGPDGSIPRTDFLCVTQVAFSPGGKFVAQSDDRTTVVKEVGTGRTTGRLSVEGVISHSFSADGKTLAVLADDGTHFLDLATGKERAWLRREDGRAEFFPGGKYLACQGDKALVFREIADVFFRAEKAPARPRTDPPGVPLEARLVARQTNYVLDLEGDTPMDCSNRIQFGEWPDALQVDLVLELRNTGKEPLTLHGYDESHPTIYLVGPGAVNYPLWDRQTGVPGQSKRRTLAPGATCGVPVTDLQDNIAPFWLLPGEYTLAGNCSVNVSPAPKGSAVDSGGFGYVTVRFSPIKVKVVAGKKLPPPWLAEPPPPAPKPPPPGTVIVPQPEEGSETIREKLSRPISLDKGIDAGTPLKDVLKFFAARHDLTLRIDKTAFKNRSKGAIDREATARIPPMKGISLRAVLQILLDPMDADVDVRKDTVWIVSPAKPRDLAERLPRAARRMRKQMEQPSPFEKGIPAQTPLTEALALLRDRYDLNFYIDPRAFRRAGIEDIGRRPVKLAPGRWETSLGMIVKELLDQAGATFVLRDHLILVVPAARR